MVAGYILLDFVFQEVMTQLDRIRGYTLDMLANLNIYNDAFNKLVTESGDYGLLKTSTTTLNGERTICTTIASILRLTRIITHRIFLASL